MLGRTPKPLKEKYDDSENIEFCAFIENPFSPLLFKILHYENIIKPQG